MNVREAIALLQNEDPEAEVHICSHGPMGRTEEATELFPDTATYGLLLPPERQKHVKTVVFDTAFCGL